MALPPFLEILLKPENIQVAEESLCHTLQSSSQNEEGNSAEGEDESGSEEEEASTAEEDEEDSYASSESDSDVSVVSDEDVPSSKLRELVANDRKGQKKRKR